MSGDLGRGSCALGLAALAVKTFNRASSFNTPKRQFQESRLPRQAENRIVAFLGIRVFRLASGFWMLVTWDADKKTTISLDRPGGSRRHCKPRGEAAPIVRSKLGRPSPPSDEFIHRGASKPSSSAGGLENRGGNRDQGRVSIAGSDPETRDRQFAVDDQHGFFRRRFAKKLGKQ